MLEVVAGSEFNLLISNLARPPDKDANAFFKEDGVEFSKAFERHFKVAQALERSKFPREAYFSYLLATECLLKDLYVLSRFLICGASPGVADPFVLLKSGAEIQEDKLIKLYQAERFKHDLNSLINFVKSMFPELDKQRPETLAELSVATTNQNWASLRYLDPAIPGHDWPMLCEGIERALLKFVNGELGHIYPGGLK